MSLTARLVHLVLLASVFPCSDALQGLGSGPAPRSPSFSLKERFERAAYIGEDSHERMKRFAMWYFRVKFPAESQLLLKWSITFLLDTEKKHESRLAIAIPTLIDLPQYLADDPYTPSFESLFGDHIEPPEEEAAAEEETPVETEERTRRDSHVHDRWSFYRSFVELLSSHGEAAAHECLLRTICEVAEAPLHFGIMGDFFNLLMSPSAAAMSAPAMAGRALRDHLTAEELGRSGGCCHKAYSACNISVFDRIPVLQHHVWDV